MWTTLPREPHAFSIQVFDTDDNRALGKDNVIGLEPTAHHVIDISSLDSGDYVLKMIVYNFDTGISVSGTAARSGLNFTRELEFARIVSRVRLVRRQL